MICFIQREDLYFFFQNYIINFTKQKKSKFPKFLQFFMFSFFFDGKKLKKGTNIFVYINMIGFAIRSRIDGGHNLQFARRQKEEQRFLFSRIRIPQGCIFGKTKARYRQNEGLGLWYYCRLGRSPRGARRTNDVQS